LLELQTFHLYGSRKTHAGLHESSLRFVVTWM
jgi:hypothetical protein